MGFLHPTVPACAESTSLGYAPSLIEFVFDTTRAVTHLVLGGTLERCPDLRLIVAHDTPEHHPVPGRPHRPDRVPFVPGAADRAPAGVKAYFRRLYYELSISASPQAVASVLQLADPERIWFGSDCPALFEEDVHSEIEALAGNPLLKAADLEMIQRRNALQLFPAAGAGSRNAR